MNLSIVIAEFLGMGGPEMAVIFVVVLLLFGGKKLPEFARGLGKGIREFKEASEGVKREIHKNINEVHINEDHDVVKANKSILEKKSADQEIVDELRIGREDKVTETPIPTQQV